jgi:hypothetical protein
MGHLLLFIFLFISQSEHFAIYYDPVDSKTAEQVLTFAEKAYSRMIDDFDYPYKNRIVIYLCSTEQKFKLRTNGKITDWHTGCAYPEDMYIVIKSPRAAKRNIDLQSLIAHEIAHVLLGAPLKRSPPRWFDEGVAMYESSEWKFWDQTILSWAVQKRKIISLSKLEKKFPTDRKKEELAYAESFSAIAFMIERFGKHKLRELISNLAADESFKKAIKASLGISKKKFYKEWKRWIKKSYKDLSMAFSLFPWVLFPTIFFIVLLVRLRESKRKLRRLRYEDIQEGHLD